MSARSKPHDYFTILTRRTWITWLLAGLLAGGLNLAMFLFLPHMVDPDQPQAHFDTIISHVNVIRMKRPETQVRHRPIPPPEPPEVKPKQTPEKAPTRQITNRLTLPFEVNPHLPTGPGSLELPPWESAPMMNTNALHGTFDVGQLDGPLTTLARIPPVYPIRARRRAIEGWVKVTFIVDETGKVGDITISDAQPVGLFEKSVEQCVRNWRFKPGTVEGVPVRAKVETTIRFELE